MAIDVRDGICDAHNPMDITNVLNPLLTPPSWSDREDSIVSESDSEGPQTPDYRYNSAPQPMEIDGEISAFAPAVTSAHHPDSYGQTLPAIQFKSEEHDYDRPTPRMCQVVQAAHNGDQNGASMRCFHSNSHSPPRRVEHIDRRRSSPLLRTALRRLEIFTTQFSPHECSLKAGRGVNTGHNKKKIRKSALPHSNKAYIQEQVHWIRYHFIDCDLTYAQMKVLWAKYFPDDPREFGDSDQCFSSRLYRDNISAMLDEFDRLVLDAEGKPKFMKINVRDRRDPKYEDFPFKHWEKNPEWALYWDWVMPEHKAEAQKLIDGTNLGASQLRKERSRRAIRMYEAMMPAKKGWFATPALHAAAVLKMEAKNAASRRSITS